MRQSLYLILFLTAVALQAYWGRVFGWEADFILAALITLAFFARASEIIFISALAVFWLSWNPSLAREIILIALFPLLWAFLGKQIPVHRALIHFFAVIASIALFYVLVNAGELSAIAVGTLLKDIAVSSVCAVAMYQLLRPAHASDGKGRMTLFTALLHDGQRNRI
ncbi:MAG: hypothetical protein A2946_00205 [Candidatus Liptonbacteria bacterium RIFCSPLOWO2_01_FULL_53_13]|uniref:Rod shape-determining protein MreD n=1 Tax=Candidatus Liptonbacteria bacterium RIFCSPLOWO2_01_FULL_53_13 TaxID=1798651 RepID=A0A1G2CPU4_9BACT|nr:MAG: hypothetical protein A2946_00205 [Candidatus Liptonbacteria bacterium RIFCSPLOWO2_01_FULL_53_13]